MPADSTEMQDNLIIISVFHYEDGDELVRCECGHGSKAETLLPKGDARSIDAAISAVILAHETQVCGLETGPDVTFEHRDEWPSASYFLSETRKDLENPAPKILDFVGGEHGETWARIKQGLEMSEKAVRQGVTCECDPQLRITTSNEGRVFMFGHDRDCREADTGPRVVPVSGYEIHD